MLDFENNNIGVMWQDKRMNIKQARGNSNIRMVANSKENNWFHKRDMCYLIQVMTTAANKEAVKIPKEIDYIRQEYQDIFGEPKGLPPKRSHDHKIPLEVDNTPINANPYKCPYMHKSEIENIVKEMTKSGIVRHRTPPCASPVLLVKKD